MKILSYFSILLVILLSLFVAFSIACGDDDDDDDDDSADDDDNDTEQDDDDDIDDDDSADDDDDNPVDDPDLYYDEEYSLVWQNGELPDEMDQDAAGTYCATLELGGFDDWKLPTIDQLRSFIKGCPATMPGGGCEVTNECPDLPCQNGDCLGCETSPLSGPGVDGAYWAPEVNGTIAEYWASTYGTMDPEAGWVIDFCSAKVLGYRYVADKLVRCVRKAD